MDAVLNVVRPLFWGVLMLSAIVFLHEGGHFLAARAVGVRVTEFFLGLPCRFNLHHVSRRIGTRFGVTPILLGGYAMVCGMEPGDSPYAARVLGLIHRCGTISVEEMAKELSITEDEALEASVQLLGWGSVAPVYDPEKGEGPASRYYPSTYAAMPRDAAGATIYDGRSFARAEATSEGEAWEPPVSDEEFLARERSRTYLGQGFWKRAFILVAGIVVNILTGFLLLMSIYSIAGIPVQQNLAAAGAVDAASPAAEAGIEQGDIFISVNGEEVTDWITFHDAVVAAQGTGPFELVWEHDGEERSATFELADDELLGIAVPEAIVRLNPIDSARVTLDYIRQTADSIARLINPTHTLEVLDGSTSLIGISVLSAEAASQGADVYLEFAALISFSLGFMNLLPIPPLDGGKLVIEVVQAIVRRPVPLKVQTYLSYIGIALFGLLFIYMLRADVIRFIL